MWDDIENNNTDISGSNIDAPLICSWSSEGASKKAYAIDKERRFHE